MLHQGFGKFIQKDDLIYYSSHLAECNNVLMEQFLQGNVPIRHQLKEEFLFMSRQRSAIIEDNDWAHHQTKKIAI